MVEAIVLLGLTAVGVPAGVYLGIRHQRAMRAAWDEAARRAGLRDVTRETSFLSKHILTGHAGAHRVRLEGFSRGKYDRGTRLVIEGGSSLTLLPISTVFSLSRALVTRDIETGDEGFDAYVHARGDPAVLCAVLDVKTRRMVRHFLEGHLWPEDRPGGTLSARAAIRDGDLVLEVQTLHAHRLRSDLPGIMAGLLPLVHALERPPSLVKRLIENTLHEPEWRMRLESLRLLATHYPAVPATREALERGCQDERQEVQLNCALALDDEKGQAVLLEIASREWSDDPQAARAVAALGSALPVDRALVILAHALRTRREETARACLARLGGSGEAGVVNTLAKVMRVDTGELAVDAARALGASRLPAAEAPLLDALDDDGADLRLAAAEALGQVGSPAAVIRLKQAAERDDALRRAARQAIEEIQARTGGAAPGQVSLTDGGSGEVSLADEGPEGRVSMARPPAGGFDRGRRD